MPEFTPQEIVFGAEGLDFQRTIDLVPPHRISVGSNWVIDRTGRLTHRLGETSLATGAGTPVHTLDRLGHPTSGDRILIGGGTVVYLVPETGGAASSVETGFSGDPLSVVPDPKIGFSLFFSSNDGDVTRPRVDAVLDELGDGLQGIGLGERDDGDRVPHVADAELARGLHRLIGSLPCHDRLPVLRESHLILG